MHVLSIHRLDEQADGGDHHDRVGGLDGDDDIVELLAPEDPQKLHTALDDALRGVAIARHDAVGERAVVHADAHGGVVLLAGVDEGHQLGLDLPQLGGILIVGVFQMLERAPWVDVVAGIDTHLLAVEGSHVGGMGGEVDVGHQRLVIAVGLQTSGDVLHVLRLTGALGGEAHQFAAGIDDALGLTDAALCIIGIHGGHRLDADGVVAADADRAYAGYTANSSFNHTFLFLVYCL